MSVFRIDQLEDRLQRRKRISKLFFPRLKDRNNPLEWLNSEQFKLRFHMFKDTAIYITNLIKVSLISPLKRGCQLPPILQFLVVVRFYATGSFQLSLGDLYNLSQPSVCLLIKRVSKAIALLRPKYIKYPSFEEVSSIRQAFYEIAGFPGVVGAVDCTHVKIDSPGGPQTELFRNRKGWYGSAHDSRIFENSAINTNLEENLIPGILLGDSGYSLLRYLLVPVTDPTTRPERRYNYAQIATRNTIERAFGVYKRRFPCLLHLRVKLTTALIVVVATGVLHNILGGRNDIYDDDSFHEENAAAVIQSPQATHSVTGRAKQRQIINDYFSQ